MTRIWMLLIIIAVLAAASIILLDRECPTVEPDHDSLRSEKLVEAFMPGNKTVADRLKECGVAARARLPPHFRAGGISYPPDRIVLAALKNERRLEVWAGTANGQLALVRTCPILGASGRLGPKLSEGDLQVPEGLYRVESLNPNSRFHLSLRLNYPNEFDRAQGAKDGRRNLGGDIMIHGGSASIGCLAMGDTAAEDLFVLAAETRIENVSVIISPIDFRTRSLPRIDAPLPEWTAELYRTISERMKELQPARPYSHQ